MAVFDNTNRNETFRGTAAAYDQVDYQGRLSDYTFTRNADGSVTVTHPRLGTDTLWSIEGFWFHGEQAWYSMDDAIRLTEGNGGGGGQPGDGITGFTVNQWGVREGTAGDDVIRTDDDATSVYGGRGDDTLIGEAGTYSQVEYDGQASDYTFTQNADGTVTVTGGGSGTDTLTDMDGVWFVDEARWYAIEDLVEDASAPQGTGRLVDGVITGTDSMDDLLLGTDGNDTFYAGMGEDRIEGGRGGRDTLNVDGDVVEWTFTVGGGEVVMSHPTWGENTLTGVEFITFGRSGETLSITEAVEATAGLGRFRMDADDVLNGTPGNDRMRADADGTNFYGGLGNDRYVGRNDAYDQVNFDGDFADYTFTRANNGNIIAEHPVWGRDVLVNIDGVYFNGEGVWMSIDALVG